MVSTIWILWKRVHMDCMHEVLSKGDGKVISKSTHRIASLTCSAYDLQMTKISWTPANARLSNVQSNNVALHTGSRHYSRERHPMYVNLYQRCKHLDEIIRTLGLPTVSGLNRLLKLSARMTAWRTSSSPPRSFSLPEDDFGGI